MQDSIEDYIRISKNIKDNATNQNINISTEILATVQRKKECEDYAMKIVLFLMDGKLRPEIFLKCLKYINQDYYQDIVEERSITKLCGYPMCGEKIPEMPKQKYFISTKANKVYDISDRKNYCSNLCYNSSIYVKNQVDSSPLWLRNHEDMVDCKLWPSTAVGVPGEEVDQGTAKGPPEEPQFTSITQFTQFSLEEAGNVEKGPVITKNKQPKRKESKQQCSLNAIEEDSGESDAMEKSELFSNGSDFDSSDNEFEQHNKRNATNKANVNVAKKYAVRNSKSNSGKKIKSEVSKKISEKQKLEYLISKLKINNEPKTKLIEPPPMKIPLKTISEEKVQVVPASIKTTAQSTTSTNSNKQPSTIKVPKESEKISEMLSTIEAYAKEWITIDTFIYIYGEGKVTQILNENKMEEYFDKLKVTELETSQQLKYMNICKRLHMQEMAEEKFDNAILGHSLKPLPDFKQLKNEVQEMDLKARSFYSGALYEKQDTNFPTTVKENEEEPPIVLPLVDISAQNALRRKVFLNSVTKPLKKLIYEIGMDENYILSSASELVKSFKLEAHNVIFKPTAVSIVAVILLKILSIKDTKINSLLKDENSTEHIDLILSNHNGAEKVIEDIVNILADIEQFLEIYISNKR